MEPVSLKQQPLEMELLGRKISRVTIVDMTPGYGEMTIYMEDGSIFAITSPKVITLRAVKVCNDSQ